MLNLILQIWGGAFYLLNKIFFSQAERSKQETQEKKWRVASWAVYLIGLPAWVIIFVTERNWMAAAVETGGAPAMFMGLIIALRGKDNKPKQLDHIARIFIIFGIIFSIYDFGGITTINQVLEIGIIMGFLIGTYLLAKKNKTGYLWFMMMNTSNTGLMIVQHYPWLALQQIISLLFVLDAYKNSKKSKEPF